MAKYLLKVRYSAEGLQGVMREGGSARRAAAEELAKSIGGAIESFHFAFGDNDAYVICEAPDNSTAAALAMTVSSTGRASITTVPLLTVEDVDAIAAGNKPSYRAPGA
jgi:uncharacterized protein with GYD domain